MNNKATQTILDIKDRVHEQIYAILVAQEEENKKTYAEVFKTSNEAAHEYMMHRYGKQYIDALEWRANNK